MTWFNDGDGWRDDSTEGPYDTLKVCLYAPWQIFRSRYGDKFRLTNEKTGQKWLCETVQEAKDFVKEQEGRE